MATGNIFSGIYEAFNIPGWMELQELLILAFEANRHFNILEVGSWKGRSSKVLSYYVPNGGTLTCVDNWTGPEDKIGFEQDYYETTLEGDVVYNQFRSNVSEQISEGKIIIERGDSSKVLRSLITEEKSFDMIFIDGDHHYKTVKQDIVLSACLLSPGGLLCGHDYLIPDVSAALKEIFTDKVRNIGNHWYIV